MFTSWPRLYLVFWLVSSQLETRGEHHTCRSSKTNSFNLEIFRILTPTLLSIKSKVHHFPTFLRSKTDICNTMNVAGEMKQSSMSIYTSDSVLLFSDMDKSIVTIKQWILDNGFCRVVLDTFLSFAFAVSPKYRLDWRKMRCVYNGIHVRFSPHLLVTNFLLTMSLNIIY